MMEPKGIILFDGVCNLCNQAVQLIIRHDPSAYFCFASLQSDTGKKILQQYNLSIKEVPESMVLIENNKAWLYANAALRIARRMRMPYPLLFPFKYIIPRFILNYLYRIVATNRYRWQRQTTCLIPDPELTKRFL